MTNAADFIVRLAQLVLWNEYVLVSRVEMNKLTFLGQDRKMGRADRRLHPSNPATLDDIILNSTYIGKVHDWTKNYKRAAT